MAYTIKKGDTLTAIAKQLGTTVQALAKTNNIADVNRIYAGHQLMLPGEVPATDHPLSVASPAPSRELPGPPAGQTALQSPSQIPSFNINGQTGATGTQGSYLYGTPRSLTPSPPGGAPGTPSDSGTMPGGAATSGGSTSSTSTATATPSASDQFNQVVQAMLKAAQSSGNDDLMAKRNAIIQARFNAGRAATPEELRVLSPQAQAGLRSLDTKGLEDQLTGINTAINSRDEKAKATADAQKSVLQLLLQKQTADKPTEVTPGNSLVDSNGNVVYTAPPKEDLPPSAKEYEYAVKQGYQGTYNDYQNMDANRRRPISNTYISGSGLSSKAQTAVNQITGQFDNEPIVKQYNTIAETVNAVKNAGKTPTDDIQRIYAFAKVMDPNSAVREGEYKTVQDYSTSLLQRTGLKANRVFNNDGFLTTEARNFINNTLTQRLKSSQTNYNNVYNEYGRRINKVTGSSDGTDYLTNYGAAFSTPQTSSSGIVVVAPDGTKHSFQDQKSADAFKKAAGIK